MYELHVCVSLYNYLIIISDNGIILSIDLLKEISGVSMYVNNTYR
jgi:hypothetical protein